MAWGTLVTKTLWFCILTPVSGFCMSFTSASICKTEQEEPVEWKSHFRSFPQCKQELKKERGPRSFQTGPGAKRTLSSYGTTESTSECCKQTPPWLQGLKGMNSDTENVQRLKITLPSTGKIPVDRK